MRIVRGFLALGTAALAQALLSHYVPVAARYCDLFTILVSPSPSPIAATTPRVYPFG